MFTNLLIAMDSWKCAYMLSNNIPIKNLENFNTFKIIKKDLNLTQDLTPQGEKMIVECIVTMGVTSIMTLFGIFGYIDLYNLYKKDIKYMVDRAIHLNTTCAVCLETISPSQIFITKCRHAYHTKCIFEWYKIKNECPLCKKNIR